MKIALFLPNWIGDAVMATPAIDAICRQSPNAEIIGVMKPYVAGVVEGSQWFHHTIFANDGTWRRSIPMVARQLRRHRVDLAVLFPNSFRSALTAWLGGCRRRIGYDRYGRRLLLTDAIPPLRDGQGQITPAPVLEAYNRLAEQAGCPPPGHRMRLFTTSRDEAYAAQVWKKTGLDKQKEVICLNPGAAFGAAKYWPWEHFARLAQKLTDKRGCGVLVLCGPKETGMCRKIVKAARRSSVQGLARFPLSIGLTKACVKRCSLLITTDSGPRHFAAAFQRPVITLFGPTHIEWTETHHPMAFHLQKEMACGPCQKRVCPLGHHRCMTDLHPRDVYAAAEHLLRIANRKPLIQRHSA